MPREHKRAKHFTIESMYMGDREIQFEEPPTTFTTYGAKRWANSHDADSFVLVPEDSKGGRLFFIFTTGSQWIRTNKDVVQRYQREHHDYPGQLVPRALRG